MDRVIRVFPVGLKHALAVEGVNHAASHRYSRAKHFLGKTHRPERLDAPMREGQVDGAPTGQPLLAGVVAHFVDFDGIPGLSQMTGHQRAPQAAADHHKPRLVFSRHDSMPFPGSKHAHAMQRGHLTHVHPWSLYYTI